MNYESLKKALITLSLAAIFALSVGITNPSVASAQYRERRWGWRDRDRDRDDLERIRRFDFQRRLRYRMNGVTRIVGYQDRYGRFHAYGFYDRFGRFHRY